MKTRLVGNTHVVSGGPERLQDVLSFLREEGIETEANPDLYVRAYKKFGIDEARELRERASLRALGKRRIFIIAAPDLNREAQNALLKTLEEPPGNALFFFVLPSPESLLPTLRSRVQILRMCDIRIMDVAHPYFDTKRFLAAPADKRLDMLKPLLEKGDDDKRDLGAILAFLSSLEEKLAKSPQGLKTVYRTRKYVTDKGALIKPLLEQVALLVPRV
ncbi:hypothetical protein A3B35_01530 [Candidatus Kaiserbacteria bacterium RIFCSPLOWO2_01_FULL_54_24]|uniref:DNA polymerase III subunit delta n=1 Tax=Candidatus Kaiserbacteria bacterium RIFCSPLOWO2_01_FULL_54_24 TaxID=1798515 RepID=A0A1F6EU34_9BACT|nr:MAG: hypothetical protein A3B35_01530 [Candidatus Kaiserbacteria bacterium RIFCSPLOWO2_01_FULL_54_24]